MSIKCKEILFNVNGPLGFKLTGGTTAINPHYKEENIVSLEMPDNYFIAIGDSLKIKKKPYKINMIEQQLTNGVLSYNCKIAERTKSSLFVLPMLGGNRQLFLYNSLLLNAFIEWNTYNHHIILLYRWSDDPLFTNFIDALKQFNNFVGAFDIDAYHIVFVFDVPERHRHNYQLFRESKYSKMDDIFKLKILDFHDMDIHMTLGQILFRASERREELEIKLNAEIDRTSELLSCIDEEKEILNIKHYIYEQKPKTK